mgnify:CR=1 FL=1
MDRRLAGAALIATPLLALIFRGLGASGLRPLTACLVALAIYWGLLALALRFSGGWSLRPRWPGRAVGLVLVSCVTGMAAVGAGALAGLALGVFALRHTRIDVRDGKPGYTPNPWIGGALSLLLVGRLAWRWYGGAFSQGAAYTTGNASPLTMSLAATLVVYSLVQAVGLSVRMRALA